MAENLSVKILLTCEQCEQCYKFVACTGWRKFTKFCKYKNPIFVACLYAVMLPWQRNTRQLKYQNTEGYLFILCHANFGDPGINGFGKIENATQATLCSATF